MTTEPSVVAHIVRSLGWGGLEQVVLDLCRSLDRTEWRCQVISLSDDIPRAEQFAAEGIPVEVAPQRGLDPGLPRRLATAFRRLGADLVHVHNVGPYIYASVAARLAGLPCVYTQHGAHTGGRRSEVLVKLCHALAPGQLIAVSEPVAESLRRRHRRGEVRVIPNGIDVAAYADGGDRVAARAALGLPADRPLVVHVGRLVPVKNHRLLLEALTRVDEGVDLALCGDGPLRTEIEEWLAELGLTERVHLLGLRDDIPRVLAAADICCLCSHSEGLPLALIEAMAAGLPVVATEPAGGCLVEPGRTGLLTPAGEPGALAEALNTLAADPGRRVEFGRTAREIARARYSLEAMAAGYDEVYRAALVRRRARPPGGTT